MSKASTTRFRGSNGVDSKRRFSADAPCSRAVMLHASHEKPRQDCSCRGWGGLLTGAVDQRTGGARRKAPLVGGSGGESSSVVASSFVQTSLNSTAPFGRYCLIKQVSVCFGAGSLR